MANKNFEVKHGLSVGGTERITSAGAGTLTNLTLSGNLTVNGTTVTLDTTTLQVADKNIVLNYHASNDTTSTADGAGITIQDAVNSSTDATLNWSTANDRFVMSHGLQVTSGNVGIGISNPSQILNLKANTPFIQFTQDGTDSYAGINFGDDDDANDGQILYDHDSRYMRFQVANAERVRIDASGRVGIGTTSPNTALEIAGSPQMLLHLNRAASTPGIKFTNGGSASGTYGYMVADENEFGFGYYDGSSSSTKMYMSSDGDVSIGTSNTYNRLTISKATDISMSAGAAGQLRIEGNGYSGAIALNGDAMHIYQNSTARNIVMGNNETEQFRLNTTGQILANSLGVSTPTFAFINDTNTGMTRPTTDTLQFVCGGTEQMRITPSYVIPKMNFHFAYNNIYAVSTTNDELGNGQGVLILKQQISVAAGSKIMVWYDSGQILNNNQGGNGSSNSNPQIAIYVTTNSSAPPNRGADYMINGNTDHFLYPMGGVGAARVKMNGMGATGTLSSAGTYYIYVYGGSYNSGSYSFNYQDSSTNTRGSSIMWAEVKA